MNTTLRNALFACSVVVCTSFSAAAQARDTQLFLPLNEALNSANFIDRLDPNIQFFFGDQPYPASATKLGEFVTNKKTNAFGKSDVEACQWVLLSAMLSLQERALAQGGNAVVNIRSYYKKDEFSSAVEYECHAGALIAGVALIGEVVRLP